MNRTPIRRLALAGAALLLAIPAARAEGYKYTPIERIHLTRDLTAEYATAKTMLPRAKKPLPVDAKGNPDQAAWADAHQEYGPAARAGDLVQITDLKFEKRAIILEINGGFKGGRKWWERIQVGAGSGTMSPIQRGGQTAQPVGTQLMIVFPGGVPQLESFEIKELLSPLFDFEQRSATEQYLETLPQPVQAAINEKRAIEGMNDDTVLLAHRRPVRKVRETKDGVEYEDWIYGEPPGKVTFVTFRGSQVVAVKDTYAGLGGSTAPPLPVPK